ncbi:unnamed protein product [Somion occarium]|uniref:Transcription and mRNA export factor SUS1 n=1 Tax=Somion occarium TaxID=3059160 RepID=A0ABP1D626_9APHY
MPSRDTNGSVVSDEMYAQIQRRLLESGEWDRIYRMLELKLNESGWMDELHDHAKELARQMYPISVRKMTDSVSSKASSEVPENVKAEVTAKIRQYLDSQLEK